MSCGSKLTFQSVIFKIGCQDAHWNDKNKCKITFTSQRSVVALETGHLLKLQFILRLDVRYVSLVLTKERFEIRIRSFRGNERKLII